MGSRRGFICRMKIGNVQPDALSPGHVHRFRQRNSLGPSVDGNAYAVVHCTGYIKNWPTPVNQDRGLEGDDGHHAAHSCLVAIGRLQVTSSPDASDLMGSNSQSEFVTRHSMDGKFTFVDQRVPSILGYQTQELLGKSCFDFFHPEDQEHMKQTFEQGIYYKIPQLRKDIYYVSFCSRQTERTNYFRHVSIQGEKLRLDLHSDEYIRICESLYI